MPGSGAAGKAVTTASVYPPAPLLPQLRHDGRVAQCRVAPLIERLEDDEHRGEVRTVGLQEKRDPGDGDRVRDARRFVGDFFDQGDGVTRSLQAMPNRASGCSR